MNSNTMLVKLDEPILTEILIRRIGDTCPDLSYYDQDYSEESEENRIKYKNQDIRRIEKYNQGDWCSTIIEAKAYILVVINGMIFTHELHESIAGVESDDSYNNEYYQNEFIHKIISDCHNNKIRISPFLKIEINQEIKWE